MLKLAGCRVDRKGQFVYNGIVRKERQKRVYIKVKRAQTAILLAVLLSWLSLGVPVRAQVDPAVALLARMTAQEKVGQLFIVAFWGRNPASDSWIGKLIREHKIGGVVLLTSNSNLSNQDVDTPASVAALCGRLQTMALSEAASRIPLFIAVDHEGDGFPYTRITNGVTPLPNPMAIGATWDTRYAEQVGEIVGRELAAMGINMLLGPVVDVLDDPRPGNRGDVGSRVFGGDPYWVGEMGRAYIRGVHVGSADEAHPAGRVLTVAKHFPGHGGSDRLPDEEVATVDKSLQELKRVELAPFFAVTNPKDPAGLDRTDALMSSHIRYRGFYGDIRQFTRPISFDAESMQALLSLSQFREWRKDGVIVSDSLGVPAVRKYFDPQLRTFPHRQIAREAFLAGNDLLVLSQFSLVFDLLQHYTNVIEVLAYFRQAYERESAFAARVDEAVLRILRLKLKLYPELSPEEVLSAPEQQIGFGEGTAIVEEVARKAATVLYPTEDSLPRSPRRDEDILILIEERMVKECYDAFPECEPHPLIPVDALQEAILRLYGPEGTGQVDPARVNTRTFAELKAFLTLPGNEQLTEAIPQPTPEGEPPGEEGQVGLNELLQEAEWIVFCMLEPASWYPDSDALQLFLAQDAQRIYEANVVVLAYTVPYYLDATEISKLTAYYVFYSKVWPFIEISARMLFGEVRPQGRSPVSIEGTYYDLTTQLSPDPAQQIELELLHPAAFSALVPVTLRVRTGSIRDRNGHPVPDGTQVRFIARDSSSRQEIASAEGLTVGGMAEVDLLIDRPAPLVVVASSGDVQESLALAFDALPPPTSTPLPATSVPTPVATPTVEPTATSTPTSVPTRPVELPQTPAVPSNPPASGLRPGHWAGRPFDLLGALVGIIAAAGLGYLGWGRRADLPRRVRLVVLAWVGGAAGYLVFGLGWAWVEQWIGWPTWIVSGALALLGAFVPAWAAGPGARRALERRAR